MARTLSRSAFPQEPGIEVIDAAGKPLLVMPQAQVVRQRLRHRTVLVCLRNAKGSVFLYRNPLASAAEGGGDLWLPAVHGRVLAGESRYGAAARLLAEAFGVAGLELAEAARFALPASGPMGNTETTLFLSAKTSSIPRPGGDFQEGMFLDQEEFRALARDYPHLLPPLWSPAVPYLFPG